MTMPDSVLPPGRDRRRRIEFHANEDIPSDTAVHGFSDTGGEPDEAKNGAPPSLDLARRAGRGAMWAVAANLVMRFASIAVTALLARLLSKEDFGVFAIALAVFLVVSSLAELGMASAIARSPMEPDEIAPTVASISMVFSAGLSLVMALTADLAASALGQPQASAPIRVLALCLFLTGFFAVPGAQLVRNFRQDRIFVATMAGFVTSNTLLVALALNGGGATAFAWSRVLGQIATGAVFLLAADRLYRPSWNRKVVGPLLRFGLPLCVANFVNWTLMNADYLVIGRMLDAADVGVYMIAFNVANWSTAVLGSVLNSVVVPLFGRASQDPDMLARGVLSATRLVALVSLPIGALTLVLSDDLVTTIFGPAWIDAAPVLSVLSIYGVLYCFSLLYANVLVATGATGRLLLVQLAWLIVLIPAVLVGVEQFALGGAAWGHVAAISLVALPAYFAMVVRTTRQPIGPLLRSLYRPAGAALAGAALAWAIAGVFAVSWQALLFGGLAGGLAFLVIAAPVLVLYLPGRFRYHPMVRRIPEAAGAGRHVD